MELESIINSDLSLTSKIVVAEVLFKSSFIEVSRLKDRELTECLYFLLKQEIEIVVIDQGFIVVINKRIEEDLFYKKIICNYDPDLKKLTKANKSLVVLYKQNYNNNIINIYINIIKVTLKKLSHIEIDLIKFFKNNNLEVLALSKKSLVHQENKDLKELIKFFKNNNLEVLASVNLSFLSFLSFDFLKALKPILKLSLKLQKLRDKKNPTKQKTTLNLSTNHGTLKELKKEAKKKNYILNEDIEKILLKLRDEIIKYNTSIGSIPYFHQDWKLTNKRQAKQMLSILPVDDIIEAISWFFTDNYWRGKVFDLSMVSKHYQKFLANRKNKGSSDTLINAINKRGSCEIKK